MNPFDEELLSAYLDGELTAEDQARVERRLAEDVGYRHLHDELRALRQHIEMLPMRRLPADFRESVLAAAERQMVAPQRSAGPISPDSLPGTRRWLRPLVWTSLVAAAAVVVMIFSPDTQQVRPLAKTDAPVGAASQTEKQAGESFIQSAPMDSQVVATQEAAAEAPALAEEPSEAPSVGGVLGNAAKPSQIRKAGNKEADRFNRGREDGKEPELDKADAASTFAGAKMGQSAPSTAPGVPAPIPSQLSRPQLSEKNAQRQAAQDVADDQIARPRTGERLRGQVASEPNVADTQASPSQKSAAQEEGFFGGIGGSGAGGLAKGAPPSRSAFDAAASPPPARDGGESAAREREKKEPGQLVLSIRTTGRQAEPAQFEKLLGEIQQPVRAEYKQQAAGQAPDALQHETRDSKAETADKLQDAPAALPSAPADAVKVYDVDLTPDALVELLNKTRAEPEGYRLENPPAELVEIHRAVQHRAVQMKLKDQIKQIEQADGRTLQEVQKQREVAKSAPQGDGRQADETLRHAQEAPLTVEPPIDLPRSYRVRIVLRQGPPGGDPPAAAAPAAQVEEK